jgi:hypothetical protein
MAFFGKEILSAIKKKINKKLRLLNFKPCVKCLLCHISKTSLLDSNLRFYLKYFLAYFKTDIVNSGFKRLYGKIKSFVKKELNLLDN